LSGWSSEVALRNRVGSGRNNLQPTLSALWFAQPIIPEELIGNQETFERGLTARLLIFDSEIKLQPDDGVERAIPGTVMDNWRTHIHHLVKTRPSPAEPQDVRCSPGERAKAGLQGGKILERRCLNRRRRLAALERFDGHKPPLQVGS
jgi:hypothetical protein